MTQPPISQRMRGALAGVWEKSRDRMFERVATIDEAAAQLLEGALAETQRRDAERAAHQLAGTCGTFGFGEATDLAREAEHALAGNDPVPAPMVFRMAEIAIALRAQLSGGLPWLAEPVEDAPAVLASPMAGVGEGAQTALDADADLILALDDDPEAMELISALLVSAGYRVSCTTDPQMFMELLPELQPSMVMLDVDMPAVNGIEVCRRLRADRRWVAIPVLFLTARTDGQSVARMFEAGADDYVAKPVVGPDLIARIRNRLERSRVSRAPAPSSTHTTDVVVVDDDDVLVALLAQSLGNGGYSVTSFGDGPVALDALTARPGAVPTVRPRVIVLDVGLPGMDGLTVLRALARQGITRASRVVMLTARTSEDEVVQALELGAFDHVAKPFSVPILLQRIRRAIDMGDEAR